VERLQFLGEMRKNFEMFGLKKIMSENMKDKEQKI